MNDLQPINFPGLDPRRPLVIAGPCSAETEEQVIETARELAAEGFKLFRAGLWKPRTKPGGFEGVGVDGIAWLQRVKRETGMYTATEVATRKHVLAALEGGIDMIWIGARTTANPFAMQEIADALRGHDIPVLVKNPVSPDLELWIGGVERIYNAGIRRLGVIHRGFTSIDKSLYRNHPMPLRSYRRKGWGVSGGITFGYKYAFNSRLALDMNIGVGYAHFQYDKYKLGGEYVNFPLELKKTKQWIGPTKFGVSLTYNIFR